MIGTKTRYVVVTPVRDEEAYLRFTIECMVNQTVRPVMWVIVNDGSTDGTRGIIEQYASQYSWIKTVNRENRGFRKAGGGVVDAFYDGYRLLADTTWDFIVKFDGDLSFAPNYFEECLTRFASEPQLGVGGGVICHITDGVEHVEEGPAFHVRGATKIYRKECWEGIGGFWPAPGWDTMDEVKASMLGWTTKSFRDLHLAHHRHTGAADGVWKDSVKNGRANYICGYHPLFMVTKCFLRMGRKPYIVNSVALFYGFVSGYLKRIPQVDEPETIRYLRRQQLSRLIGGKSIWK